MTLFFRIWWITLFIKIILGACIYVFPDETYYWFWSHHLQLSYFDHPLFISRLLWLSHALENYGGLLRLPLVLMSHATLFIWYHILKNNLSDRQQVLWLLLAVTNPLFGMGGIIATPDIPLLFFWSGSIYFILKIINGFNTDRNFIYLGAFLGLGFCSKYNIVLLPLLVLAWMVLSKKNIFTVKKFILMTITGLIFCMPVIIWNYQNNFESFFFQLNHGLGAKRINWTLPFEYIGGQIALLLPPILFLAYKQAKKDYKNIMVFLAWGPILFFLVSSFKGRVEANWPIVAYPAMMALAANYESNWLKYSYKLWMLVLLIVAPFLILKKELPIKLDKITEIYDLQKISAPSLKYEPLYGANYQISSYLTFLNKKDIFKLRGMSRRDFYDYLPQSMPSNNFYLVTKPGMELPRWAQSLKIETVETVEPYVFLKISSEP